MRSCFQQEPKPAGRPGRREAGVALVITLIMLALITTLTVAFLALTRSETGSVSSKAQTTATMLSTEAALERAKAEIVAAFRDTNVALVSGPDLMASVVWQTNRLAPLNLLVDPSPPVFPNTNRAGTQRIGEDRFYLDLNRNGYFDETGNVPVTDDGFQPVVDPTSGLVVSNWVVGDPQWIGILKDGTRPHAPDNRFVGRYAFLVMPAGRSLDLNWIHNQAINLDMRPGQFNGYYRNQGVGPWELNLAGFLADLNPNYWGNYQFDPFNAVATGIAPSSAAFDDARELLRYRYTPMSWDLLAPPPGSPSPHELNDPLALLAPGLSAFVNFDGVDGYGDGPPGPFFSFDPLPQDVDDATAPWPGADSRRHYFTLHDVLDPKKLPEQDPAEQNGFRYKMAEASARGNSYDRYTYYRMLAQLGTDSVEEEEEKVNLNYMNIRSWANPNIKLRASDGIAWTNLDSVVNVPRLGGAVDMGRPGPELFLLSVVTNLLMREPALAFTVTNAFLTVRPLRVPVFTNGSTVATNGLVPGPLYSGRLHQILQLAANIHDATTGPKRGERLPYFPSVFRPVFEEVAGGNVYLVDYLLVEGTGVTDATLWRDLDSGEEIRNANDLVYGIPLIIGARKGFPTFNELGFQTTVSAVRRLRFTRVADGANLTTNQLLILNMTNQVSFEAWNSYRESYPGPAYPRQLDLVFQLRTTSVVTNSLATFPATQWQPPPYTTSFVANAWRKGDFHFPTLQSTPALNWTNLAPPEAGGFTNQWSVVVTNRMLFFLVDNDRIVDAVSLNRPTNVFSVGNEMSTPLPGAGASRMVAHIWSSEASPSSGLALGVDNQITISKVPGVTSPDEWRNFNATIRSKEFSIEKFNSFIDGGLAGTNEAPFVALRRMVQTNYFRAADPLVHYTAEDSHYSGGSGTLGARVPYPPPVSPGRNPEYTPWDNGEGSSDPPGQGALDPTLRDPGVRNPDLWDFPTNNFPNVGWLGRVHRGTPWQTVYLKSKPPAGDWNAHSGPLRWGASAQLMEPRKDWGLADIFTTAVHPNATRGRLSINQTNLAAWSAVLSGILVSAATNDPSAGVVFGIPEVVTPAALGKPASTVTVPVATIVEGINRQRGLGQWSKLGDILSVPELTFRSPFLSNDVFNAEAPFGTDEILDSDYERIPQQILSLLQADEPRFVIYAWGQSLKPARRGVETDLRLRGPSILTADDATRGPKGLCINYQVTGEMAVKAVVRVDFEPLPEIGEDGLPDPNAGQDNYRRPRLVVESYNVLPVE